LKQREGKDLLNFIVLSFFVLNNAEDNYLINLFLYMLNTDQKKRAVDLINNGLSLSPVDVVPITIDDIFTSSDPNDRLIVFTQDIRTDGRNPFLEIFKKISKNRNGEEKDYYHFKNISRALEILDSKLIQINNLSSNEYNDFSEFSEFFNRIDAYNILVSKDFDGNISVFGESESDRIRRNILIFCLSNDFTNQRFWNEYASNENGLCLKFHFSNFKSQDLYNFRDVFYDKGYDVEFIKHINYYIKLELSHFVATSGLHRFAQFYKRDKYRYECETRLTIDTNNPNRFKGVGLEIKNSGRRNYMELPIIDNATINPLFDIKLMEIISGNNVTEASKKEIYYRLKNNFNYHIPFKKRNGDEISF
jgi:hypothetical protein